MVRAKFKVTRIERSSTLVKGEDGIYRRQEIHTVVMHPVGPSMGGHATENDRFFAATPSGEIRLGTVNASAAAFDLDGEYYIDFTKAEED